MPSMFLNVRNSFIIWRPTSNPLFLYFLEAWNNNIICEEEFVSFGNYTNLKNNYEYLYFLGRNVRILERSMNIFTFLEHVNLKNKFVNFSFFLVHCAKKVAKTIVKTRL